MEKFFVADSYKDAEIMGEPYLNDKGRLYVNIKTKCPRCGGLGIIVSHVENGKMIPIPVDGGICYKCNGDKYIKQSVRAYSEKEYKQLQAAKERRLHQKEEARKKQIEQDLAKADELKHAAALRLGFNEDEKAYMIVGDNTYAIKDDIKAAGGRFHDVFKWYTPNRIELPDGYSLCEFSFDDVYTFNPIGNWADLKENVKDIVQEMTAKYYKVPDSEYYPAEVKDRIRNITARLTKVFSFDSFYGFTYVYTFEFNKYVFVWMTSKNLSFVQDINVGDEVTLTGTIKKFDEYKNIKQTVLTRCKIEKVVAA